VRSALERTRVPQSVRELYGMWMFEVGPDFWAFCLSGVAEASAVRELFALPLAHATRISFTDPHPPPYLRALLAFDWCRRAWGRGPWDDWEREWKEMYPLAQVPPSSRQLLRHAQRVIPLVSATLFDERFRQLGGRALPDLFELSSLSPSGLRRVTHAGSGILDLRGVTPCTQLAAFRQLRDGHAMSEARLDELMSQWLQRLGEKRHTLH
jgi:hypothetical protein